MQTDKPTDKKYNDPEVIVAEKEAKKTSTSKGEQAFDWLTYGAVGGIGTFIATIPIAYWAKYTGGAKVFAGMVKKLQKIGLSEGAAENAVMTTATMQGGNFTLIPIKLLENCKPGLVEKFNTMLGDKSQDASVENDTKQTWGSLIKARLIFAWLPVFACFEGAERLIGKNNFSTFKDMFSEQVVCKLFRQPTHTPGLAKILENETRTFRLGKIAALDIFATVATSTLLYVGSRIFSRKSEHWHAKDAAGKSDNEKATATPTAEPAVDPDRKLFTDTISPSATDTAPKTRSDNYTQMVATQKAAASRPLLSGA